jgi:hypothetical protein
LSWRSNVYISAMSTVSPSAVPCSVCALLLRACALGLKARSDRSSQGEHLLHVLNTLESRAVVLEAELQEINEDIEANTTMARKYGDQYFTEGATRLAQAQVRGVVRGHTQHPDPCRGLHRRRSSKSWLRSVGSCRLPTRACGRGSSFSAALRRRPAEEMYAADSPLELTDSMGDRASRTSMRCASSPCAMCRSNRRSSLSRCGARRRRRPHVARKHLARRQPDASGHDEPDLVRGESAVTLLRACQGSSRIRAHLGGGRANRFGLSPRFASAR